MREISQHLAGVDSLTHYKSDEIYEYEGVSKQMALACRG
jgi:hypothetical protein